ncbi:hypothetical protein MKX03_019249, partial [Papaver bracteatum]
QQIWILSSLQTLRIPPHIRHQHLDISVLGVGEVAQKQVPAISASCITQLSLLYSTISSHGAAVVVHERGVSNSVLTYVHCGMVEFARLIVKLASLRSP